MFKDVLSQLNQFKTMEPIQNRGDLYSRLNHTFLLPSLKSSFVTIDYLARVYNGSVYAPKYNDITIRNC